METNNKNFIILTIMACLGGLSSCNNESDYRDLNVSKVKVELVSDSLRKIIEANIDTTVHFINNINDIKVLSEKVSQPKVSELERNGWKKVESIANNVLTRATNEDYTTNDYVIYEAVSRTIANSQFIARFSTSMVNEINSVVDPTVRISANKKYVCDWRYIQPFVNLGPFDYAAILPSPLCALKPSKRDGYSDRGYEAYTNSPGTQFMMITNILNILYEDVNHETAYLTIQYPFYFNHKGYEFKYSILTIN